MYISRLDVQNIFKHLHTDTNAYYWFSLTICWISVLSICYATPSSVQCGAVRVQAKCSRRLRTSSTCREYYTQFLISWMDGLHIGRAICVQTFVHLPFSLQSYIVCIILIVGMFSVQLFLSSVPSVLVSWYVQSHFAFPFPFVNIIKYCRVCQLVLQRKLSSPLLWSTFYMCHDLEIFLTILSNQTEIYTCHKPLLGCVIDLRLLTFYCREKFRK